MENQFFSRSWTLVRRYIYPFRLVFFIENKYTLSFWKVYREFIFVERLKLDIQTFKIYAYACLIGVTTFQSDDEMPSMETLQWADGLLLVYSITDRTSFNFVRKAKEALAVADPEAAMPLAMVGNKADMVHLRQVSAEEGEILAKDFECWFSEISAAEQVYFFRSIGLVVFVENQ